MKERFVEYCDGDRIEVDVLEGYHFKEGTKFSMSEMLPFTFKFIIQR